MNFSKEGLDVFIAPLRKVSGKRCLSPSKQNHETKRHRKRKTNNPVLILKQNNLRIDAGGRPPLPTTDLATEEAEVERPSQPLPTGGTDRLEARESKQLAKPNSASRTEIEDDINVLKQTENAVSPETIGSPTSLWASSQSNVSRRGSGTLSNFSSSYTSWTRPEAGNRISDSCVPNSSILDKESSLKPLNRTFSVPHWTTRKTSSRMQMKRDSSADTSKDIDDLEDFEVDGGLEELLHDDDTSMTLTDGVNTDHRNSSLESWINQTTQQ